MDNETFEQMLDRHGADLKRWPDILAAEAKDLVERSARARGLLVEARDLESALDEALPVIAAPLGLHTRVLANLPEREAWFEWLTVRTWRPVALALVPLAVGFGVGLNVAQGGEALGDAEYDVLLALFDPDELARYELPGNDTALQP
ncbi:MAG: hypothetical protein OXP36_04975 [Gammaproteobacteria bacterium]|nr:hypothetical protein [Gammaproteobacteria bacterium]